MTNVDLQWAMILLQAHFGAAWSRCNGALYSLQTRPTYSSPVQLSSHQSTLQDPAAAVDTQSAPVRHIAEPASATRARNGTICTSLANSIHIDPHTDIKDVCQITFRARVLALTATTTAHSLSLSSRFMISYVALPYTITLHEIWSIPKRHIRRLMRHQSPFLSVHWIVNMRTDNI